MSQKIFEKFLKNRAIIGAKKCPGLTAADIKNPH